MTKPQTLISIVMAEDIERLVTRVKKGKGYSDARQTELSGFVCPRANSFGGREGIIPPGIAAQRGLVPARMHEVTIADAVRNAEKARSDGKTDEERYREYYGSSVVAGVDPGAPGGSRTVVAEVDPSPVRQKAVPAGRLKAEWTQDAIKEAEQAEPISADELYPGRRVEPPAMFSGVGGQSGADDTLDGFYDGISGYDPGTGKGWPDGQRAAVERPERSAPAATAPRVRGEYAQASAMVSEMLKMSADNNRLREELERTTRVMSAELVERNNQIAELQRALGANKSEHGESVRVVLAEPEEKLKIGGDGWECRIMGRLHYSRTRGTLVLTVSDTSYAAEILADIAPGRLAVVSARGRTSCTYGGNCAKIYGESGSPDFITCFRMTCDDGAEA